jgi:hypothetical protein
MSVILQFNPSAPPDLHIIHPPEDSEAELLKIDLDETHALACEAIEPELLPLHANGTEALGHQHNGFIGKPMAQMLPAEALSEGAQAAHLLRQAIDKVRQAISNDFGIEVPVLATTLAELTERLAWAKAYHRCCWLTEIAYPSGWGPSYPPIHATMDTLVRCMRALHNV